jgi:hypothetical protein
MFKGRARRFYCDINVRSVGFRHLADLFTGGGVDGPERLAGLAGLPPR